jgi:RHS repeat-associated protein
MKGKIFSCCLFLMLVTGGKVFSQGAYIYGATNVSPGAAEYYEAQFDIQLPAYSNVTWTVIGGTILSENVNPTAGVIWVVIQWDNSPAAGMIYINENWFGQYGELLVNIGYPVDPGTISTSTPFFNYLNAVPAITEIAASGGNCGGSYNYNWESSPDGYNWTFANIGSGESYPVSAPLITTRTFIRRAVECNGTTVYSNVLEFNYQSPNWENRNFIRTNEIWYAGKTDFIQADNNPIGQKQQTTTFYDGLGRPEQLVIMGNTPAGKDMVMPYHFDAIGRNNRKYMSYPSTSNDGKFKPLGLSDQQSFMSVKYPGESHFYTETKFEESPLNRTVKELAQGQNWGAADVGTASGYDFNTGNDLVRIWKIDAFLGTALPISNPSDVYGANTLYKIITTDESNKKIIEYKDMSGNLILKKQQKDNTPGLDHTGWLCTYYVYDDMGRQRYVITPTAVEQMNNAASWVLSQQMADGVCYKYVYDSKNRVIEKKLPDADPTYIVYDARGRIVFSQDGNQRAGKGNPNHYKEWSFFIYDAQNRQLANGIMLDNTSNYTQSSLQAIINNPTYNSEEKTVTLQTDVSEQVVAYNPVPLFPGNGASISFYQVSTLSVTTYDQALSSYISYTLPYASNFENMDPQTPSTRVRGLSTKIKSKVLGGGNNFIFSTMVYDEKAREIQRISKNVLNHDVRVTNQYDFTGKLRSNIFLETFSALTIPPNGYTTAEYTAITRQEYDIAGRSKRTIRNVSYNPNIEGFSAPITSGDKVIVENTYNEEGQVLNKQLAPGYAGPNGSFLEKIDFEYNVRGWLTGMNKPYISSSSSTGHFFGMELGYDRPGAAGFTNGILNGNISGMAWKSAGDNTPRKYDYQYDNLGRLAAADFNQKNTATASNWTKDKYNFSVSGMQYNANGNILRMEQQGVNFSGVVPMDKMSYGYDNFSNKLKWVAEDVNSDHKLGDFTDKNPGANNIDYLYDENGNSVQDNNKGISSITYNYLNRPELITITGKGTIKYIYDAAGNKLQKVVTDNTPTTGTVVTTTSYSGPIVFAGNDVYLTFEEGRARYVRDLVTSNPTAFTFDYYVKDHLGNVRIVLTEETPTHIYPTATMETDNTALEDKYYNITNRTDKPVELQSNSAYDARYGLKMSKLSSLGTNNRIGPSILLKVMSGDIVHALTDYYYKDNGTQQNNTNLLNDLTSNLLIHLNKGNAGLTAKAQSSVIGTSVLADGVVGGLISDQNSAYVSNRPKAFLNYIVFDEQFNAIVKGFKQVENNGPLQPPLARNDIQIGQNGWIYVFVNNESEQSVYFDNFKVVHGRGNLAEENHYYPFGLTMKAISPRALSINPVNKTKYNSKELQNEEFAEGTGLENYDYGARFYEPQIGRWMVPDASAEKYSSISAYSYSFNNPIVFVDPDGKDIIVGAQYQAAVTKALQSVFGEMASQFSYDGTGKLLFNGNANDFGAGEREVFNVLNNIMTSPTITNVRLTKQDYLTSTDGTRAGYINTDDFGGELTTLASRNIYLDQNFIHVDPNVKENIMVPVVTEQYYMVAGLLSKLLGENNAGRYARTLPGSTVSTPTQISVSDLFWHAIGHIDAEYGMQNRTIDFNNKTRALNKRQIINPFTNEIMYIPDPLPPAEYDATHNVFIY